MSKLHNQKLYFYVRQMIEGLKNPSLKVNMRYYMAVDNNVCIGCAATNTLLRITKCSVKKQMKIVFKESAKNGIIQNEYRPNLYSLDRVDRVKILEILNVEDLENFECAIDTLRKGNIFGFLDYIGALTTISEEDIETVLSYPRILPCLTTETYLEYLSDYERFCHYLKVHNI